MKIQNPAAEELGMLDKLISGVFMPKTPDESMAKWFNVLLGEDNQEHINCVYKDERPVASVNWYSSSIKCEDAVITVGSIGAVCCDENERRKGYADTLLKQSFEQMKNEGIALCFISGRMEIYFQNNAFITGKEYQFCFSEKEKSEKVIFVPSDEMYKYANVVYKFHSIKENRFIRSFEHTKKLLKGFGSSHHRKVCELYYTDSAYVIIEAYKGDEYETDTFNIVEYGGENVVEILKHICFVTGKKLTGKIEYFDKAMLGEIKVKDECNLNGTLKIINPEILFNQLKFTFARAGIKEITIMEKDENYVITVDKEKYSFDFEGLHTLIFEGKNAPECMKNVFPLHMPIIDGLDII